jgi:hypothetical protein
MPTTTQHIQSNHVARCAINAAGSLRALAIAALNAQAAGRGDKIGDSIIGMRIVSAAAAFTVSNPDGTGTATITYLPYDVAAVNGLDDTVVNAIALGVEVYYNGPSQI